MTNYVKSTNFTSKDSLPTGNPLKIVKGTEIDTEFNNISSAIGTKADLFSPPFSGTPTAPTATAGTNTTQIATTAFVNTAVTNERTAIATLTNKTLTAPTLTSATINSPTIFNASLTGSPTAPTPATSDDDTSVATTAFVKAVVTDYDTNLTVSASQIENNAVTSDKILAGAVVEAKIGTSAVTVNKIGTGAVSTAKIAAAAVTADKLSGAQSGSAPVFGARAWVVFDGTGTTGTNQTIIANGNIASVYKNATGDYTVTFTTALPDAHYATAITPVAMSGLNRYGYTSDTTAPTSSAYRFVVIQGGSGLADSSRISVVFLR